MVEILELMLVRSLICMSIEHERALLSLRQSELVEDWLEGGTNRRFGKHADFEFGGSGKVSFETRITSRHVVPSAPVSAMILSPARDNLSHTGFSYGWSGLTPHPWFLYDGQ
jgi:hypothetical protein